MKTKEFSNAFVGMSGNTLVRINPSRRYQKRRKAKVENFPYYITPGEFIIRRAEWKDGAYYIEAQRKYRIKRIK